MITLTDKAAVKVKQLLETENATDLALRVAVRPGGCSGYSYEMFFDGEFAADDVVKTFGEVKVVVDPASLQLLEGANLDYNDGFKMLASRSPTQMLHAVAVVVKALADAS
jgi:iron-sulfur cluster assembly accessory protein